MPSQPHDLPDPGRSGPGDPDPEAGAIRTPVADVVPSAPGPDPGRLDGDAPSRTDRLTAWASPVVGGPLGPRAARSTATWFQSTQIFLLAALGLFVVGILVQAPCVSTGWASPGKYTHACSSRLVDQFASLVSPSAGAAVMTDGSAPPAAPESIGLPGASEATSSGLGMPGNEFLIRMLTHLVPGGGLAAQSQFFFALAMMVSAVGLAFTVLAVSRLLGHGRRWQLAALGLSAVIPLAATQSFDLLAIALAFWGLVAWAGTPRYPSTVHVRAPIRAGALLGLAGLISPPALLLLAAIVLHSLPRWRKRSRDTLTCAAIALGIVLAGFLLDPGVLDGRKLGAWLDSPVGPGSAWWIASLAGYAVHGPAIAWVTAVALAAILVFMALVVRSAPKQWGIAHIALILVVLAFLVSPSLPIQYSLWLVPLACLGVPQWSVQLPWMFSEVIFWVALSLYLLGDAVANKGLSAWIVAVLLLFRLAMMTVIALTAFVKADDPPYRRFSSPGPPSMSWFDAPVARDNRP